MKLIGLLGLAAVAVVAVPANAQHVTQTTRTVTVNRTVHHGPAVHHRRKVCTVRWVHHRKVRRCFWR